MLSRWLHDRMPRSLVARAALILLLPVVALQLAVSAAFVQRYYADITRQMTRALLLEFHVLVDAAADAPDPAAAAASVRVLGAPLALDARLPATPPAADAIPRYDLAGRTMAATVRDEFPGARADLSAPRAVTLWLSTPHGDMAVTFARRRIAAAAPHQLLVITGGVGLLLLSVSFLFLRNQMRPIRRLADAAQAYGRGRVVPFRPAGALEVRAAGTAFLDMRARIERQAQARTQMLAAISHDLRTPLTRLRLGLTLMDDPEAPDLVADVDAMTRMIDAFLAFAETGATDAPEPAALTPLAQDVIAGFARQGRPVWLGAIEGDDPGPVPVRPMAIRRALENLIANALAHGSRAVVSLAFGERAVRLTVEDDGPGIPPDRREDALRPFGRLDAARGQAGNGDRAGVGLGLAIVADVARAHGGSLRLGDSALGGLRADLLIAR